MPKCIRHVPCQCALERHSLPERPPFYAKIIGKPKTSTFSIRFLLWYHATHQNSHDWEIFACIMGFDNFLYIFLCHFFSLVFYQEAMTIWFICGTCKVRLSFFKTMFFQCCQFDALSARKRFHEMQMFVSTKIPSLAASYHRLFSTRWSHYLSTSFLKCPLLIIIK